MPFTTENEKDNRMSFRDVNITCKQGKFTTSVFRKPTFSGIYTHFYSFLPSTYKIVKIHTLLYKRFRIRSDWTKFHLELVKLMDVFESNGYPGNFINNCFKIFLELFLTPLYHGLLSLETRTRLRKSFNRV